MRRQTTKEPSGPATSASARPASSAFSRKSAMFAVFVVYVGLQHRAMQVMRVVVMMVINRQAARVVAEQFDERRITADLLRVTGAAHMAIQANHLVGGAHYQMQIMGNHQYAAAIAITQPA